MGYARHAFRELWFCGLEAGGRASRQTIQGCRDTLWIKNRVVEAVPRFLGQDIGHCWCTPPQMRCSARKFACPGGSSCVQSNDYLVDLSAIGRWCSLLLICVHNSHRRRLGLDAA